MFLPSSLFQFPFFHPVAFQGWVVNMRGEGTVRARESWERSVNYFILCKYMTSRELRYHLTAQA